MFLNGISSLTHLFVLFLAMTKWLIESLAKKMKWDIFNFKMNLYLGWKIFKPLTSEAGDTPARRIFSYFIILAVSSLIISTMAVSVKFALEKNSNVDIIVNVLKSRTVYANEQSSQPQKSAYPQIISEEKYYATLPESGDISEPDISRNYPARR